MTYRPKVLPTHALWAVEDAQANLRRTRDLARNIQEMAISGDVAKLVILAGDIRDTATATHTNLTLARLGQYQNEPVKVE